MESNHEQSVTSRVQVQFSNEEVGCGGWGGWWSGANGGRWPRCNNYLAKSLGVERRLPDEAMSALLAVQIPIRIRPMNLQSGGLDSSFLALRNLNYLCLVFILIGPSSIHAEEHFSPILH